MNDETSKWLMDGYATSEPHVRTGQVNQETRVESTDSVNKPSRSTIGERYKIRNRIAETGASFVYEAWDEFRQLRVAIKELRLPKADAEELADLISRFEESAEITRHPKIVEVKKFLEIDGRYYIVMEFMDAGSLDDRVKRIEQQALTLEEVKTVMNDLFAALEHSHQSKIIHRDVKPANILLSSATGWKLTDFGIARIMSSTRTRDGTFLGTPAYSSPEQVKGLLVDERTDVYSCGVVLYELLAGQRPFRGGEDTVKRKIVYQEPVPPSTLGKLSLPALDKVVARAMAKDRDQRYATIAAFREAMDAALRTPSPPPPPPQIPPGGAFVDPRDRLGASGDDKGEPRQGFRALAILAALIFLGAAGYAAWRTLPGLLPPVPKPVPSVTPFQEPKPAPEPTPPPGTGYMPPAPPSYPLPPPPPSPVEPPPTPPPGTGSTMPGPSYPLPPEPEPVPPPQPPHELLQDPLPLPPHVIPAPPNQGSTPGKPPGNGARPSGSLGKPNQPFPPSSDSPGGVAHTGKPSAEPGNGQTLVLPSPSHDPVPSPSDKPSPDNVLKPPASRREVGLFCASVTTEQVKYLNIPDTSVPLVQVQGATNGLAADRVGIHQGDVLQKTGDLSTRSEFPSQCLVTPNSGRAVVKVWRNQAWQSLTLQVN